MFNLMGLLADVKSTDPIHFLWVAGDPPTQRMMDMAQQVDGPVAVSEFA